MSSAYIEHAIRAVDSGRPIVFYDTETTGLDQIDGPLPRIWELAGMKRSGPVSEPRPKVAVINCGIEIPAPANKRGIDPRTPLLKGMDAVKALSSFATYVEGAVLVGHNIGRFDNPLLAYAYASIGLVPPLQLLDQRQCIDTYRLAMDIFPKNAPGSPAYYNLGALGEFFGCRYDSDELHGAGADVALTAQIFDALILSVHPGLPAAA